VQASLAHLRFYTNKTKPEMCANYQGLLTAAKMYNKGQQALVLEYTFHTLWRLVNNEKYK